jgi:hypothetical protein
MVVPRTQLFTFLFLILIALQQSCRTTSAPQPPSPEQAPEAEKAGSPSKGDTELSETEPSKVPKLSPEPKQREILPESVLGAPEKEFASPGLNYNTVLMVRALDTPFSSGWEYRKNQQGKIVGFEFSNRGGNRILPHRYDIGKNLFFSRDFQFRFDDRARQDIHLFISDWVPSRNRQFGLSELMNSAMYFFPRNYLPAIVSLGGRFIVTLPTGEEVDLDANTHEVLGGVFLEAPVDLHPDKAARKFPGIRYIGKGVVVRADSRGTDPRLGTMAMVTTGSPASVCEKETGCDQCQVPAKELWDQKGALRFKFSTDEEFDRYLISRCGFGVPKNGPHFMLPLSKS